MMKFARAIPFAAATLAALTAVSAQAAPVTTSADGRAQVLQQITATKVSDLDFGTIVPGTSAATVTVNSAGVRTCGAGITCTGAVTAPGWLITTSASRVLYWNGTPTVTLTNPGGATMTVNLLNLNSIHNMPASGSDTIHIGAILNVGANQADGLYTGTFTVDFNYA